MFLSVHPAIQPMSLRLHQQQPFFHQAACVIPNWQLKSSHSSTALLHTSKWYPHTSLLCPTSSNLACQSELFNNLLLICSFLWGRPGSNFFWKLLIWFFGWKFLNKLSWIQPEGKFITKTKCLAWSIPYGLQYLQGVRGERLSWGQQKEKTQTLYKPEEQRLLWH